MQVHRVDTVTRGVKGVRQGRGVVEGVGGDPRATVTVKGGRVGGGGGRRVHLNGSRLTL